MSILAQHGRRASVERLDSADCIQPDSILEGE